MSVLHLVTAGESHGPALIAVLEGLPAGLAVDRSGVDAQLARRQQGVGSGGRMKIEQDRAEILSGVMGGLTTGAPLAIRIENRDHSRWRGRAIEGFTMPRPGHVDLAAAVKYGYRDLRPGLERASARETAARVAAGAICRQLLAHFGIQLVGYVIAIGPVIAEFEGLSIEERYRRSEASEVRCPDPLAADGMLAAIQEAIRQKDTLGGIIEVAALGLPIGLGSHVESDRRLEARLGAAVLSVPAIKGMEIGPAFENTRLPGTQAHDPIRRSGDRLIRTSNRAGGVEGGITNGQPLMLRAAMKPIATTLTPQPTVDLRTGQETDTVYERSDFCPVPRAVPILEAVVALVLADALLEKLGGDSLAEMDLRFASLRQASLSDLEMDAGPHDFWPESE